jgi:hypothetical protein
MTKGRQEQEQTWEPGGFADKIRLIIQNHRREHIGSLLGCPSARNPPSPALVLDRTLPRSMPLRLNLQSPTSGTISSQSRRIYFFLNFFSSFLGSIGLAFSFLFSIGLPARNPLGTAPSLISFSQLARLKKISDMGGFYSTGGYERGRHISILTRVPFSCFDTFSNRLPLHGQLALLIIDIPLSSIWRSFAWVNISLTTYGIRSAATFPRLFFCFRIASLDGLTIGTGVCLMGQF